MRRSAIGAAAQDALGVLGPGEVEDRDGVLVGDAKRLAGPADPAALPVEAAIRVQHNTKRAGLARSGPST
jgi:hypothetical protein